MRPDYSSIVLQNDPFSKSLKFKKKLNSVIFSHFECKIIYIIPDLVYI